jgi:hypothetical protein
MLRPSCFLAEAAVLTTVAAILACSLRNRTELAVRNIACTGLPVGGTEPIEAFTLLLHVTARLEAQLADQHENVSWQRSAALRYNPNDTDRQNRVLRDDELDAVSGGSFELGNIVGSIAKAPLPLAL